MKWNDYKTINLDIDLQLLAGEMDTQVKDLVFLSDFSAMTIEDIEEFDSIWEKLKEFESFSSFDDDTELYDIEDAVLATHETLTDKYVICENKDLRKIKIGLAVI